MGLILAFAGHRPQKIGGYWDSAVGQWVYEEMRGALLHIRPTLCLSGMALGVDQWGAELALALGIPFWAIVPFEGYEERWPDSAQAHYRELLAKAANTVYVCSGGYDPQKMQRRNEYLVDKADVLLAVYDGTSGGTQNCYHYAEKRIADGAKLRIERINPCRRHVGRTVPT